jgi:hypothetical protein
MRRGDPPPELVSFDVDTAVFNDSPLSAVYYNVKNELKQRNNGRAAASHHRIALWAAWEAHKTAKDSHGVSLLRLVGLPETQKAFAEFLGVSDRTVRNYRDEYGEFVGTAQTMTFNRLLADYRLDAAQALGQVATDKAHPQFAQSQRTFFTLTGDLVDKQDITSGGEKVQQITVTGGRPHLPPARPQNHPGIHSLFSDRHRRGPLRRLAHQEAHCQPGRAAHVVWQRVQ